MKKFYVLGLLLMVFQACAFQSDSDSTGAILPMSKRTYTLTARVHTMGLFMYMGKVVNRNPAADIFFNITGAKGWGVSAFKVVDVNDIHSHNNFAFAFVHKTFRVGKTFSVAPWVGFGLEQQHAVVDHGSDVIIQLVSNLKIKPNLTLEHLALFNNLAFETTYADWTNRIRLIYTQGHVDVTGYIWHNNALIDAREYTSTGLSIFYNRIPVGKRTWLGAGINTLATVSSSDIEKVPIQTGIQFSTALTFK